MKFPPTPEQQAILDVAATSRDSLMLDAMAGCAKTTTLTMLAGTLPVGPSLALAFNVKIRDELEKQFPKFFKVKTMNGLGHGAWQTVIGKRPEVDDRKIGKLIQDFLMRENLKDTDADEFINLIQMVKRARTSGLVPQPFIEKGADYLLPDNEESWEAVADSLYIDLTDMNLWAARQVLMDSIHMSYKGVIDYDDQIYMSALFGGVFPKYPRVMVDEAQDQSPLNHVQIRKCAIDWLAVCGDPRQGIYAFRGADSSSMESMRRLRKVWIDRPLSLTFRCPKLIVARQQSHAPGFTAAESAPDGMVDTWLGWDHKKVIQLPGKIAILCRNNAPLMACALRLIRSGVGCTVLGREIGKSLIALSKKLCSYDGEGVAEVARRLADWKEKELSLAQVNGKEERMAIITDKAECLQAVMSNAGVETAGGLRQVLHTLFDSGNNRITLSTGHKAKGLEWDSVIHLDPFRIPSKFAKMQKELGNPVPFNQDMNLKYVIETRSKNVLIMANLDDMSVGE